MEKDFSQLIKGMPKDLKVLDIGCGGLSGENTTCYLLDHFGAENILGLVRKTRESERFSNEHPEIKIIWGEFPDKMPKEQFDLVVADLNIDNNMLNWSRVGMNFLHDHIRPDGHLINYIMLTDDYGDEDTPEKIRTHWKSWWGGRMFSERAAIDCLDELKEYEVEKYIKEPRRNYITWVKLRRISG